MPSPFWYFQNGVMRSHADIIRDAGGPHKVRDRLGLRANQFETVKSWYLRDSIPAEHWRAFHDQNLCTLDELATHAALRGRRERHAA